MDCVNVKKNLPFFGDGSLDPVTEQAMDRHIANCSECAEVLEEQLRVVDMVKTAYNSEPIDSSIDLTESIRRGIDSRKQTRSLFRYLTPVAAAAVVVISMFVHGVQINQSGDILAMTDEDYEFIGTNLMQSYEFLAYADYYPEEDYYDMDPTILLEAGFVELSAYDTYDMMMSLDEETMYALVQQALY